MTPFKKINLNKYSAIETLSKTQIWGFVFFLPKTFKTSLSQTISCTYHDLQLLPTCPSPSYSALQHQRFPGFLGQPFLYASISEHVVPSVWLRAAVSLPTALLFNNKLHITVPLVLQLCLKHVSAHFWPSLTILPPQRINMFDIILP